MNIEIKTVMNSISFGLNKGDEKTAQLLMDGWKILSINYATETQDGESVTRQLIVFQRTTE